VPRARWAGSIRPTLSLAAGSMVDHGGLTVLVYPSRTEDLAPHTLFLAGLKVGPLRGC
jgi:hypothetical protein